MLRRPARVLAGGVLSRRAAGWRGRSLSGGGHPTGFQQLGSWFVAFAVPRERELSCSQLPVLWACLAQISSKKRFFRETSQPSA